MTRNGSETNNQMMTMKLFKDPILLVLLGLLATSLLAFLVGAIHYPYGLLILILFITARIMYKK